MRVGFPIAMVVLAAHHGAQAKPITVRVTVVDRTDRLLFVEPGAERGLRPGDIVEIAGKKRKIISTSASFATAEAGGTVAVGAKGTAVIEGARAETVVFRIEPAEPLGTFQGQWGQTVVPAAQQNPKPVPLGPLAPSGKNRLLLRAAASGFVPIGGSGHALLRTEERARLHYEPFHRAPFTIDADVAAETWSSANLARRPSPESRPVVAVRQLELGYGRGTSGRAAAGRLRYASSTVGTLDGVRLDTPSLDGFSALAFGGLAANPFSGTVESRASRFGGELRYDAPDSSLRPHFTVGGHASRFDGAFDERRLGASADLYPDFGRFGARGELSFFDRQNPWGADRVELSAIDADVGLEFGLVDFGVAAGMHRPERSRWLASYLPPEWLCVRQAGAAAALPCVDSGAVYTGSTDVGVHYRKVRFDLGGSLARTTGIESRQTAVFANIRLSDLVRKFRMDTGAMLSTSMVIRTAALMFVPGIELLDGRLDASVRYRPAITRYAADTGTFIEHDVGPSVWFSPAPAIDVSLEGDFISGRDLDVVLFQAAVGFRPGI